MYTLEIASPQFKEFTEKAKDLLTEILKDVTATEKDLKIPANSHLFSAGENESFLYLYKRRQRQMYAAPQAFILL